MIYEWNRDISNIPKDKKLLLASKCGKVTASRWLPPEERGPGRHPREIGRWQMFDTHEDPVAWMLFPTHPGVTA